MNILPSVDIHRGRCVKLVQGKPSTGLTLSASPLEVAFKWEAEGARMLHVVDLDGAMEGSKANRPAISEILGQARVPVEVGGGIRTVEDVCYYLDRGARWVILGTAAVEGTNFLEAVTATVDGGRIIVALDFSGNAVLTRGWSSSTRLSRKQALERFRNTDVYGFLVTNVGVEGTLRGVDFKLVQELVAEAWKPLIYSGGVAKLQDIRGLATVGVESVVIGRALYDGRFTLSEAQAVADEAANKT
ncbi:MAG: 1-(5-phosphoribosyl)-5-[(5-phosphoribosylamino)methylideneamino]imidazole-4-carboxamide isomerase [Candidatus Bathyarchaeia archaeon]